MNKLSISVFVLAVIYLFMTFFVANIAEKQINLAFSDNEQADFSTELIDYQRHFFTATAVSKVHVVIDHQTRLSLNIVSNISHFPFRVVIENQITIADERLAKRAEAYFGSPNWLSSVETINLFSTLNGQLNIAPGKYENTNEVFSSGALQVDYEVDLKNKNTELQFALSHLSGASFNSNIKLNSLQLNSQIGALSQQSDYDYKLIVDNIEVNQENNHSLLQGLQLIGSSRQGKVEKTIDSSNELLLDSYQFNNGIQQNFTNNNIKLVLTGLYQPAFELLHRGSVEAHELEQALVELVTNGAQLSLSQLNSNTPWGKVNGQFDFSLDKGASLFDIMGNPYILLDYIDGDLSLALPATLLDEPLLAESLQMGLMTGFLRHNEQTLNLETSFQQGELIVNGRVIPL